MTATITYSKSLVDTIEIENVLMKLSGKKINSEASVLFPLKLEKSDAIDADCDEEVYENSMSYS